MSIDPSGVPVEKRLLGADLFVSECRKGTFTVPDGSLEQKRKAFEAHVERSFREEGAKSVIDFRPRLLRLARTLANEPHPMEAVVLYATWAEHWVNAILVTTALRRGQKERAAIRLVRSGFATKLDGHWTRLELPKPPQAHFD